MRIIFVTLHATTADQTSHDRAQPDQPSRPTSQDPGPFPAGGAAGAAFLRFAGARLAAFLRAAFFAAVFFAAPFLAIRQKALEIGIGIGHRS